MCVCLGHVGRHLVLKAEQLQDGKLVLRTTLVDEGSVAEAQVLQLPKDLNVKVAAGAKIAEVIIPAAAEIAARQRSGRVGRCAAQQDAGDERPEPFLTEPHQRRLDKSLLGGQLRPVSEGHGDQVIDGLVQRDECQAQVRKLQRLDEGRWVQPQDAHEISARDTPVLAGRIQRLVAARKLSPRPHHIHVREYAFASGRQLLRAAHHFCGPADCIERPGQLAARLLHVEVCLGHHQQAVVPGRLQRRLPCLNDLPFGQRSENGVSDRKDGGGRGTNQEGALTSAENIALNALNLPVVTIVIHAQVESGQPQHLSTLQLSRRHLNAFRSQGDINRPYMSQLQGRG